MLRDKYRHAYFCLLCATLSLCILCVFTCSAPALGASPVTQEDASVYSNAASAYGKGDYARVTQLLASKMHAPMPHPYACTLYGLALLQQNSFSEAALAFKKGLQSDPSNGDLQNNLGIALMQGKKYEEAAQVFVAAMQTATQNIEGLAYSAAQCFYYSHQYNKSLQLLQPLLAMQTVKEEWLTLAAISKLQLKDYAGAEHLFQKLTQQAPGRIAHWKGLAHTRVQQGKKASAVAALEVASRLPGATLNEKHELVQLYQAAVAPMLALQVENSFADSDEKKQKQIQMLQRAGRHAQVIELLDKIYAKKTTTAYLWLRGVSLHRMGHKEDALGMFTQCSQMVGEEAPRCGLIAGLMHWEAGRRKLARPFFEGLLANQQFYKQAQQALSALDAIDGLAAEVAMIE